MPSLAQLLQLKADNDSHLESMERDRARLEELIEDARRRQAMLAKQIAEMGTNESSHKRRVNATVNGMHAEHRLAISESAKRKDPFAKAIRAGGEGHAKFTQSTLAAALGVKPSMLSMYRTKDRKIPLSRAKRIEELTGWPADAKHWPCGIISDA